MRRRGAALTEPAAYRSHFPSEEKVPEGKQHLQLRTAPYQSRALRPARDAEGRDLLPTPPEKAERRIRELEEELRRR